MMIIYMHDDPKQKPNPKIAISFYKLTSCVLLLPLAPPTKGHNQRGEQ